jgi:ABC-2 type transport system permease protein
VRSGDVSRAAGILRYEAGMIVRRKGMWLAYGLLYLLYAGLPTVSRLVENAVMVPPSQIWPLAGQMVFQFNMFMALVAGIIAADCLERDYRTGVSELQRSAPLRRWPYLLGKYLGALVALLAPYLLWIALLGTALVALRLAPPDFILALLAAFAAIAVPAHAFVVAFSVACPLVLPLRVYQILFTGYWFWGNYLSPKAFPTLNGTLVTPSGVYALEAFFGGFRWARRAEPHTPAEAWLNIAVLSLCVAGVLALVERYLAWRARQA